MSSLRKYYFTYSVSILTSGYVCAVNDGQQRQRRIVARRGGTDMWHPGGCSPV